MFLVTIGITLFGCLGGLAAAFVRPPHYQADAIVIVYEMPHELGNLIGPDQAQNIDDLYAAGALQPSVMQHILQQFVGMTATEVRASVEVSIIAYTPLTRITATAGTPAQAAALANAVAATWTTVAARANTQAYTQTLATLTAHEHDLYSQIDATRKAIITAATTEGTAATGPLQAQLTAQLQQVTNTDKTILALDQYRITLIGNAYVVTPATAAAARLVSDPIKLMAEGGLGGLALGLAFTLWLVRRQLFQKPQAATHSTDDRDWIPIDQLSEGQRDEW